MFFQSTGLFYPKRSRSRLVSAVRKLSRDFKNDCSGAVAIVFGLAAIAVFSIIGASIDYGRWHSARTETMQAMDAAVLAAGRALQVNSQDRGAAISIARQYYDHNKSKLLASDNTSFQINSRNDIVVSTSTAKVKTAFLGLIGLDFLDLDLRVAANVMVGGNAGTHLEIAMVLDTTGSMGWYGRLAALKLAAKDMIDILVWDDQSQYTSRVALVPFANLVKLPEDVYRIATNTTGVLANPSKTCVTERPGAHRYTNWKPLRGTRLFDKAKNSYNCKSTDVVVPLTSDKTLLKRHIDALVARGGTAGHLGVHWGFNVLASNWSGIWPGSATPLPFAMLDQKNSYGQPKLKKIAVLMTDGEFNTQYVNGIRDTRSDPKSYQQARAICVNMKTKGYEIFTVGFGLSSNGTSYETMRQCASDDEHFYSADDADDLRQAFRDIALRLATLHLSE